jgi:hypothetical protein
MSGYTSNRLTFMLIMSLGASKALRRIWLWGCIAVLIAAYSAIHYSHYSPMDRTGDDFLFMIGIVVGTFGLMGFGLWVIANVIRFFGKHIKDDYQNDELFER